MGRPMNGYRESGLEFYNGLKALGIETEMVVYPRKPHELEERAHQIDLLQRILADREILCRHKLTKGVTVRPIRYAVATSLDGYIAGPKGEADWIIMDPDIDFRAMFTEF